MLPAIVLSLFLTPGVRLTTVAKKYIERLIGHGTEAILARKVGGVFFVNVAGTGLAFGLQILLARILGASEFGQYVYVLTWINLLVLVGKLGLDTAGLRFLPEYAATGKWELLRGFARRSRQAATLASLLIAGMLVTVAAVLHDTLEPGLAMAMIVGAILLPLNVYLIVQCSFLQAFRHVVSSQIPQVILRPILIALAVVVLASAYDVSVSAIDAIVSTIAITVIAIVVASINMRRVLPKEFSNGKRQYQTDLWTGVAFPMLLITSFNMMLLQVDILMVGSLLNTKEAGIYSAVSRIATLIPFASVLVNMVTAPLISQLYAQNRMDVLQRMMTRVAWGSFIVSLPIFLVVVVAAQPLLGIFGFEFVTGERALIILALGRLLAALTGSVGYLLSMSGHQKQAALILGASVMASLLLNAVLIPLQGIDGAAMASTIAMTLYCAVMVVYAKRVIGIDPTIMASLCRNSRRPH